MGLLYPEEKSKSSLFLRLSARQELSFCKNFYEGRDYHELDSETRRQVTNDAVTQTENE